jgi:hypothetical protein
LDTESLQLQHSTIPPQLPTMQLGRFAFKRNLQQVKK